VGGKPKANGRTWTKRGDHGHDGVEVGEEGRAIVLVVD
jgi:hypothetical protein